MSFNKSFSLKHHESLIFVMKQQRERDQLI